MARSSDIRSAASVCIYRKIDLNLIYTEKTKTKQTEININTLEMPLFK